MIKPPSPACRCEHRNQSQINERSVCGKSVLTRPNGACGKETVRDGGTQFYELHALAMQYLPPVYRLIASALQDKALDLREIAEAINCKVETTRAAVSIMHRAKAIHIYGWRMGNAGPAYPVYIFGHQPDCKRPPKLTNSERSSRWRLKKKTYTTASNMWGIACQ
jgi:hypothetical protein